MADITDAFDAPIYERIGGKDIKFSLLTNEELGDIGAQFRAQRQKQSRKLADECKLPPAEKYIVLANADNDLTMEDIYSYVTTLEGTQTALEMSLKKSEYADHEVEEILGKLGAFSKRDMALIVCTFAKKVVAPEKPAAQEKEDENLGFADAKKKRKAKEKKAEDDAPFPQNQPSAESA
jgi:hypothetical protein